MKRIVVALILLSNSFYGIGQNLDLKILKEINPRYPSSDYWKFTSASTYFIAPAVPIGLLITACIRHDAGLQRKSYEVFSALAIEVVACEVMKVNIGRKRPAERFPLDVFPYKNVYGKSFPSGHTSLAFATAASLSIQCKKWYVTVPAYLWAGSVAHSRVYLGVHYPSDIVAGAMLGVGSAYLTHWLNNKIFRRNTPESNISPSTMSLLGI